MCASDGRTYTNACEMKAENCRKGVEPPVFEKFGSCQDGDIVFRETNSGWTSFMNFSTNIFDIRQQFDNQF